MQKKLKYIEKLMLLAADINNKNLQFHDLVPDLFGLAIVMAFVRLALDTNGC
jgi:hypothetical protein